MAILKGLDELLVVQKSVLVLVILREQLRQAHWCSLKSNSDSVEQYGLHGVIYLVRELLRVDLDTLRPLRPCHALEQAHDLSILKLEIWGCALTHARSELVPIHHRGAPWIYELHELCAAEISCIGNLGQFDDALVHEVQLRHALQLSDKSSVGQVLRRTRIKELLEDSKLTWPGSNTKSVQGALKVLLAELSVAVRI